MDRRLFLTALGGAAAATALPHHIPSAEASQPARPRRRRPVRILIATNEPTGTYHIAGLVDGPGGEHGHRRQEIALVVPDTTGIAQADPVPTVTLDAAEAWGADLLVVNGATDWPVEVAARLPKLPVVASSLAYLPPQEAPGARSIRPRLVAVTAPSRAEASVFASHLGVDPHRVVVVGSPDLDTLPAYTPEEGTVVVATSVTRPSATGGAAPGAQQLLDTASALARAGKRVRVGLHPREDRTLWSRYDIATEGTVAAAARAEVTIGIPGSVFPKVAALGCPLVGVVAPGLSVPDYILALCARTETVDEAVAAAGARWRPADEVLTSAVGPLGGSRERLLRLWDRSARRRPAHSASGAR